MSPSHLAPLALAWPEPWAWRGAQGQTPPSQRALMAGAGGWDTYSPKMSGKEEAFEISWMLRGLH